MGHNPPPKKFIRDFDGLLSEIGLNYVYTDDGLIDWRKMVNPTYLVPNKRLTDETDITKLDDSKLLITLAGIRWLAQIRGYTYLDFIPKHTSDTFVSTKCVMLWLPNYEWSNREVWFAGEADASPENTEGFGMKYLTATAENRAFTRCVRNFLNIRVVGEEEVTATVSDATPANGSPTPVAILGAEMKKKGVSFDDIKAKLVEEKFEGIENIKSIDELPTAQVFKLIERLKKV